MGTSYLQTVVRQESDRRWCGTGGAQPLTATSGTAQRSPLPASGPRHDAGGQPDRDDDLDDRQEPAPPRLVLTGDPVAAREIASRAVIVAEEETAPPGTVPGGDPEGERAKGQRDSPDARAGLGQHHGRHHQHGIADAEPGEQEDELLGSTTPSGSSTVPRHPVSGPASRVSSGLTRATSLPAVRSRHRGTSSAGGPCRVTPGL